MSVDRRRRVLVTGGAGFIGSHTVDRLLAEGYRVRVLDDLSNGKRSNLPESQDRLDFIHGSVCDQSVVDAAMEGVDAVIHLAAQVSVQASFADPRHSAQTNILGFLTVVRSAARAGVSRIVFASSAAVYGVPQRIPVDESHPCEPISPYGLEKRVTEDYAGLLGPSTGITFTALRYFNVFGPRQDPSSPYSGVISIFVERALTGQGVVIYGDGKQSRDFIYVGDVAKANVRALDLADSRVLNVCTGVETSLLDLLAAIEACKETPVKRDFKQARQGDIYRSVGASASATAKGIVSQPLAFQAGIVNLMRGKSIL